MISISGRIFIQIKIDGSPIPDAPNLVSRLTMTEGGGALTPAIELLLNDYSGVLNRELALTDGNELLITVGKSPEDAETQSRQYRLFGSKQKTSISGPQIQAIGIYDAPSYISGSVRESFEANTQDVLKSIAAKCKLKFKTGSSVTEDKQIWLNCCKNRAMFVQDTIRHGRVNDTSAMLAALTSLGELRYFNLSELIETPKDQIKHMFVHNTEQAPSPGMKVYQVRQAFDSSNAGLMNTWQNYGSTRVAHSLEGLTQVFDKIDVFTASGFLPINEQVAKTIQKSRMDYSPLDCGNNHKNYYRALYQNLRLLALFSEHVSILTYDITDVQPMDVVIYRQANADPSLPVNKSDIYVVTAKTILVKGGANYAERIELVRRSLSEKGETKLAGADIGANAASVSPIPDSLIDPTSTVSVDTRSQVVGLTSTVGEAQRSLDVTRAQVPRVSDSIRSIAGPLRTVNDAIKGKISPVETLKRVKALDPLLKSYQATANTFNNAMEQTLAPLQNLATRLGVSTNLTAGVRQATLTNPAGILSAMTSTFQAVKQQVDVHRIVKGMANDLKTQTVNVALQTPEGREAQAILNEQAAITGALSDASLINAGRTWNTNLSSLLGTPIPTYIPPQPVSPMYTVMNDMYTVSPSGSPLTFDRQTSNVTKTWASKTDDKRPQWLPEPPATFTPAADADMALDKLTSDLNAAQRREQDFYPSDWTDA